MTEQERQEIRERLKSEEYQEHAYDDIRRLLNEVERLQKIINRIEETDYVIQTEDEFKFIPLKDIVQKAREGSE